MSEREIFEEAISRSDPDEQAAYLQAACGNDLDLRRRLDALLIAHNQGHEFLEVPAANLSATKLQSSPEVAGTVVAGRYTLLQKLGEGGMGTIWVAKQTEPVKRKVALKLIRKGMDSKAVVQRFEQERQALAIMDHPNIARVLDGGMTSTAQPFFVMELVNGLPLNKFCDEAKLGIRERLELFIPICQAVQHAHQKGIIHRDLKPANILVTIIDGRPVPKVIDFGVAKATTGRLTEETMSTSFGAVVGTLEYMSPEQAGYSGEDIDTRADIYSLGVILYEILTGLRPIDAKRLGKGALLEMIRILKEEEPSRPSTRLSTDKSLPSLAAIRQSDPKRLLSLLRGELDWVVMKCLEKQRDRRYETANGLARDLQHYLADEPVEARPPSPAYRLTKFLSRNKGPVLAAGLLLLALVGGIIGTTFGLIRAEHQRQAAESATIAERLARQEALKLQAMAEEATEKEKTARLDEAQQRSIAENASLRATIEREKAELGLANALFDRAQGFLDHGDIQPGLLFLARSLRELPPNNDVLADVIRKCIRSYSEEITEIPVRYFEHSAVPSCAGFLPDGQQLAVGCEDGTVVLWNLETDEIQGTKMNHPFHLHRIAVSPDGTKMIAGGIKETARLWNLSTQEQIGPDIRHTNRVTSMVFTPDSRFVATGGYDQTSRYYSTETGLPAREPITKTHPINDLAISPDGKQLISIDVWMGLTFREIETGKILRQLDYPMSISAMSLSRNGKLIALGTRDNVAQATHDHAFRLLNLETGKEIGEPYRFQDLVLRLSFNADDTIVACGARDNVVRLFDCRWGYPVGSRLRHRAGIVDLQFAPHGGLLFTLAAGRLRVWRQYANSSEKIATQLEKIVDENLMAYSRDGSRFYLFSGDRMIQVYDANRLDPIGAPVQLPKPCMEIALNYDGKKALLLFEDRKIIEIETATGRTISPERQLDVDVRRLALHPAGDLFAACVGNDVAIFRLSTGMETIDRLPHLRGPESHFSPDGDTLTTTFDGIVRFWDVKTGAVARPPLDAQCGGIRTMLFSPDSKLIAVAGAGRATAVWDVATSARVAGPFENVDRMGTLAFDPESKLLAVRAGQWMDPKGIGTIGIYKNQVRLWSIPTSRPASRVIERPYNFLNGTISPDGHTLLTTWMDGTIRTWSITSQTGTPQEIEAWVELITGMYLDAQNVTTFLDRTTWKSRVKAFESSSLSANLFSNLKTPAPAP